MIKQAFDLSKRSFISIYKNSARWTDSPRKNTLALNCDTVIRLLKWLIDNIFVTFGDKIFRQRIGIPMGTDCAPFLANLFLFSYEYEWIDKMRKDKKFHILKYFKGCSRYIDDLSLVNNDDQMKKYMSDIYPKELVLVPDDSDGQNVPFLDRNLSIKNGVIISSIYDKRDAFGYPIVNFPTLSGNIPESSSYGVFIGEAVRYARACTYLESFETRMKKLVCKLKKQFFKITKLRKTWRKFCESHLLLIQKYGPKILNLCEQWE